MAQSGHQPISMENQAQTPDKMEMDDAKTFNNQDVTPAQIMQPKPTPAIVKRKKFKDLFQSPSDSLVSPMTKTLTGKTHPAMLKQLPKPKRLTGDESMDSN